MRNDAVRKACPCTASWKLRRIFKDFSWAHQRCSIKSSSRFWTGRWWNYKQNKWSQSNSAKAVPVHFPDTSKKPLVVSQIPTPTAFHLQKSFFNQQKISCADLFSQLKSPPHLSEAKSLHARLVVSGFFNPTSTDRQLGSELVSVYVNFGCLQEALTCIW